MLKSTHNSFSYAKPRKFWMRLFNPFSKCQDKSIYTQIKEDVKLFDLRLKFKGATPYIAHGLVQYNLNIEEILAVLDQNKCIVRILLENRNPNDYTIDLFKVYCSMYENIYKGITFCGGHGAHGYEWYHKWWNFNNNIENSITENHASVCATGLDKFKLRKYALTYNEDIQEMYKNCEGYLMQDFI